MTVQAHQFWAKQWKIFRNPIPVSRLRIAAEKGFIGHSAAERGFSEGIHLEARNDPVSFSIYGGWSRVRDFSW
jgi:hypothetical protein